MMKDGIIVGYVPHVGRCSILLYLHNEIVHCAVTAGGKALGIPEISYPLLEGE